MLNFCHCLLGLGHPPPVKYLQPLRVLTFEELLATESEIKIYIDCYYPLLLLCHPSSLSSHLSHPGIKIVYLSFKDASFGKHDGIFLEAKIGRASCRER